MSDLLLLLAQHALLLVVGTTVLLSLGCGAVVLCKSPVHRQRIAELTIAGVLGWMVLALFPLPRLLPDNFWGAKPPAVFSVKPKLPIALDAAWARETDSGTFLPVTGIPTAEPVMLPEVIDLVQEAGGDDDLQKADGLGNPSYGPSPSEELPRLAAEVYLPKTMEEKSVSSFSAWQFDLSKLAGLFTGAYLAGASLCLLWIFAGYLLLFRIRQTAAAPPEWLAKQYQALAKQSGIAPPQLIVSRLCARPLTWGVIWPVVVLPQSLCRQENKSQLETILLHELGHIAQQDSQGNLLFCAALPLLYAHPLYWWLRRESQLAAELVADDWAAWQTGKETYVEELVALARCTGKSAIPLVGVTGLFSSPSLFYRRMHMLLAREKPLSTKTSLPWRLASLSALAAAVALAASLAGVRPAAGQAEPPAATPAPALTPPVIALGTTPPVTEPLPATAPAPGIRFTLPPGVTPPAASPSAVQPGTVPAPPPGVVLPTPTVPEAGALKEQLPLHADEATLLAEIKQLQDKLRALETKRGTGKGPSKQPPGMKTITLLRDEGNGVYSTEIWSTDAKGQPDRLISKSPYSNATPQPRTGRVAVNQDGKTITEELVEKDGSRRTVTIDAATGKIIAENRYGAVDPRAKPPGKGLYGAVPSDPTSAAKPLRGETPELRFPTPIVPGTSFVPPTAHVATYPTPAAEPNAARGAQQLDLVSLATSYADAVSEVELAEAKMADISKLGDSKAISNQEVTAAKLSLSAARRKEQLLRSIAEVATESAAQEFERTSQLHKNGVITASAAGEAQTRVEILKQILRTGRTESSPNKQ